MTSPNNNTDVLTFFTKSKTVWVSENFQNIILGKYVHTERQNLNQSFDYSDLQEIKSNIKFGDYIFDNVDIFLEQLMSTISTQMNGEKGDLLNDSSANYFFLKGKDGKYYSILVRWENAQKLWRCGAYLQEELKMPNVRVFHPFSQ